jgi:hypothetical protein
MEINLCRFRRIEDGRTETSYWCCAVLVRGCFWLQLLPNPLLLPVWPAARKSNGVLPQSVCDAAATILLAIHVPPTGRADVRADMRSDVRPDVLTDVCGAVL